MQPIGKKTYKITSDYYQQLIVESNYIERTLSTLSSLFAPLYLLQISQLTTKTFSIREMQDVKIRICEMISRFKEKIYEDVCIITEIMKSAGRVATQFQQLVDLVIRQQYKMNSENGKSAYTLLQLQNQLNLKNIQIVKCQQAIKVSEQRSECQQWKKNHYFKNQYTVPNQKNGATYLKVLKNIKYKLEMQLSQEQKQQQVLNSSIKSKLSQFKTRIINIWDTLPNFIEKQQSSLRHARHFINDGFSPNMACQISELEKQYVNKQKQIDEFSLSKLDEIKNKLKLLEKAEMNQSRDLIYSRSVNELIQESEVKECGDI